MTPEQETITIELLRGFAEHLIAFGEMGCSGLTREQLVKKLLAEIDTLLAQLSACRKLVDERDAVLDALGKTAENQAERTVKAESDLAALKARIEKGSQCGLRRTAQCPILVSAEELSRG